jgi:DNA-binding GntR family transcriptional regulator
VPEPMYRQIAEDLREKIESGEFGHGTQLPTELDLREQYDASRNTVRDAIKWLITRGLVQTRPGQGTFVVEKIDPFVTRLSVDTGFGDAEGPDYASEVTARSRKPDASTPRIEIHQATGVVASELQLAEGSMVVSRFQQRYIDGTPYSLQTTFYPMRLVERGAADLIRAVNMQNGAVRYLEETLGLKQAGWRDKIAVRAPDANEATFFKLPDDGRVAVFEIHRTSFEESGAPLRLTVTAYPTDRNQFVMSVGEVPADAASPPPATAEDSASPTTTMTGSIPTQDG